MIKFTKFLDNWRNLPKALKSGIDYTTMLTVSFGIIKEPEKYGWKYTLLKYTGWGSIFLFILTMAAFIVFVINVLIFNSQEISIFAFTTQTLLPFSINALVSGLLSFLAFLIPFTVWFGTSNIEHRSKRIRVTEYDYFMGILEEVEANHPTGLFDKELEYVYADIDFLKEICPRWGNNWSMIYLQRLWWGMSNKEMLRSEYQTILIETYANIFSSGKVEISTIENNVIDLMFVLRGCTDWFDPLDFTEVEIGDIRFTQDGVVVCYDGNYSSWLRLIEYHTEHYRGGGSYFPYSPNNPSKKITFENCHWGNCLDYRGMYERFVKSDKNTGKKLDWSLQRRLEYIITGNDNYYK